MKPIRRLSNTHSVRRDTGDTITLGNCALCGRRVTLSRANKTGGRCTYEGAQYDRGGNFLYCSGTGRDLGGDGKPWKGSRKGP